jgi:hypothetical protein
MTKPTGSQTDIRPLFTVQDIRGMRKALNLGSYDDVKTHAAAIYDRIRGIGGAGMPPRPRERKVLGLRLALRYSQSGWRTGTNLRRSQITPTSRPSLRT